MQRSSISSPTVDIYPFWRSLLFSANKTGDCFAYCQVLKARNSIRSHKSQVQDVMSVDLSELQAMVRSPPVTNHILYFLAPHILCLFRFLRCKEQAGLWMQAGCPQNL